MQTKKICVFGDVMLDTWVRCTPVKVSQEAPVLVCRYESETHSPGGAANVAANLVQGYDADVYLVGLQRGHGDLQRHLLAALRAYDIDTRYMVGMLGWRTIEKRRFVDPLNRQLLRLDTERENPVIPEVVQDALRSQLHAVSQDADALVISDYGKGTVTAELARYAIQMFRDRGKYIVVNGKPERFLDYHGADLLVYNRAEAGAAWRPFGHGREANDPLDDMAADLYRLLNHGPARTDILITCGDAGMVLMTEDGIQVVAAAPADVANVTGAGDVVISTIAVNGCHDIGVLGDAADNAAIAIATHGTSICPSKERE